MYPTPKYPFYGIFVKEQVESLRKEGIFVDVFFINGRDSRSNYFFAVPCLVKKLRFGHYDLVHAHHTYCIYVFWIAKLILGLKIPLILTFHEAEALKSPELVPRDTGVVSKLVYSKGIKKWAVHRTDFLISVCEDLIEVLNLKRKSTVKPPGVDLELFKPLNKFESRRKLNLAKDKKVVFFPGDVKNPQRRTQKGFDILQKAFAILPRNNVLLVTGGSISHQDMPLHFNASDVVVQTSNFEASPMVIKEAMACNIPIVSTDVGDTSKIFGDTEGCFICERDPEDIALKIEAALDYGRNTEGRVRIIELGLDLQQVSRAIISIYREVLRRS
jgi:glycosyltransferase involved in cell wall biosynthesis